MSQKRSLRSVKAWKLLFGFGLLLLIVMMVLQAKGWSLVNRWIIQRSKYQSLLRYIVAQSKVETANLSSNVYKLNNNLFGMKVSTFRPGLGVPGSSAPSSEGPLPYKKFDSDSDSIRDLLLWMDWTRFPVTVRDASQYVAELKTRSYFQSPASLYLSLLNTYL